MGRPACDYRGLTVSSLHLVAVLVRQTASARDLRRRARSAPLLLHLWLLVEEMRMSKVHEVLLMKENLEVPIRHFDSIEIIIAFYVNLAQSLIVLEALINAREDLHLTLRLRCLPSVFPTEVLCKDVLLPEFELFSQTNRTSRVDHIVSILVQDIFLFDNASVLPSTACIKLDLLCFLRLIFFRGIHSLATGLLVLLIRLLCLRRGHGSIMKYKLFKYLILFLRICKLFGLQSGHQQQVCELFMLLLLFKFVLAP